MNKKDLEFVVNQINAETDTPPPFIDREEVKLSYNELYDANLMFLLNIALCAHCNLKIDAAEKDRIIVTFY